MKKLQIVILALFVVLALSWVVVAAASAEMTLVAAWNADAGPVVGALGIEAPTEILFEDVGAGIAILCSGILMGNVKAGGADEINEIQNLKKEKVALGALALSIAKGDCVNVKTCGPPAEVWLVGLPWGTQLFLRENATFADKTIKGGGGVFGFEFLCTVLVDIVDECTAAEGSLPIENNLDAEIPAGAIVDPLLNCTMGGAVTGVIQFDTLTELLLTNGQLLTATE